MAPLATPDPMVLPAPVATTPVPPAVAPSPPAPVRPPENARELENRYFAAGTTPDEKLEIIKDLGVLEAGGTLGRVYRAERRWETKMKVLEVVGDLDSDRQHEPKLDLLQAAVAPTQNKLLRLSALDMLGGFEDPRALKIVETIARGDTDRDVRATARDILEARAATAR